jgi:hypothetical protein
VLHAGCLVRLRPSFEAGQVRGLRSGFGGRGSAIIRKARSTSACERACPGIEEKVPRCRDVPGLVDFLFEFLVFSASV